MVPIFLVLLVVGISTEQRLERYEAGVGEEVNVILELGNTGESALDVSVTPDVPKDVESPLLGPLHVVLHPGASQPVTYPIKGNAAGQYEIASQIVYTGTDGKSRHIRCGDRNGRPLMVY